MAISLNGSTNVITGVAVGGLPDGIVDTDMLAANAVNSAKLASGAGGKILQVIQTVKTDTTSTSSQIPSVSDVTGMSVDITPSASNSKILISYHLNIGASSNVIAFFRLNRKIASGSFSEIFVGTGTPGATGYYATTVIYVNNDYMAQSTSCFLDTPSYTLGDTITYKLTYAGHSGGTITLNGYTGSSNYLTTSSITAQEVAA